MRKLLLFVILLVMIFVTAQSALADDDDNIIVIEVETPTPTATPDLTPPPIATNVPPVHICKFENDQQTVDTAALAAYHSPFDTLYWKFVYWCVMYNRTICEAITNGTRLYSQIFIEVATNTDEFETWSDDLPYSTKGKEILRLNVIAADLFFDYIRSGGEGLIVPTDGVILEYVKNGDGLNRSANVYNLDGELVPLMSEEEFRQNIGKEYYRRLDNNAY